MHGSLTLGDHGEAIMSKSTINTIGAAIMCGFMLMLLIDEGVCIVRCYLRDKHIEARRA
jgi:hypothetical protein